MLIIKKRLLQLLCSACILILCVAGVSLYAGSQEGVAYTFQYYKDNNGVDVKSNVVDVSKHLGEYFSVDVTYLTDAITSASRNDHKENSSGKDSTAISSKAIDIDGLTSASSDEVRREASGTLKFFGDFAKFFNPEKETDDPTGISITGKYSKERNYVSYTAALGLSQDLFQRNTTVGFSYSKSSDHAMLEEDRYIPGAQDEGWNFIGGGYRATDNVAVFVTQGLTPTTIASVVGTYTYDRGYTGRPWYVYEIDNVFYPEALPAERKMRTVLVKFSQYIPFLKGVSVQTRYRYYEDSWHIVSHTGDIRLFFRAGEHFVIRPSYRGYIQDKAFFYQDTYLTKPQYLTTDFKFSACRTNVLGLKLYYEWADYIKSEETPKLAFVPISIDLSFDYYMRSSTDDPVVRNSHYSYWDTDIGFRSFIIQSGVKFAF